MKLLFKTAILAVLLTSPSLAQEAADAVSPEGATSSGPASWSQAAQEALALRDAGQPVEASSWMVSAANPHAVEAGAAVLADGGTAADAMIAVQTILGLVEPQSSGLGGGAFLVWFDAQTGTVTTLDGRETAPLNVTPQLFQTSDGEPLKFFDAVVGGLSVGTPGTPALMEEAHRRWGKANWGSLFDDAKRLARDGFEVSPRLAGLIERDAERLGRFPDTAAYFLPGGTPLSVGDTLVNLEYAATLDALAENGVRAFYTGPISAAIVERVQNAPGNPGYLSQIDLSLYQVKERPAVCSEYRDLDVCGMGPPSSGALTVGQILGLADQFDLSELGKDDPNSWRIIGDASRLAFADRGRYMADSDFVPVPVTGLIDPEYLQQRALALQTGKALEEVAPGQPEFDHALNWADDEAIELPSTSHISIVDRYGNVLSMTTTIENAFGSRLMVGGFLLNNELTDFSFRTHRYGVPIANRIEPGKRPRSSMSPTIVLQDGNPVLAIGSPGGSRIIGYVAKSIIAWADWGLNIQEAIEMPHAVNRFGTFDVEAGTEAENLVAPLTAMGFEVNARGLNSGLHAIEIGATLRGAADPRREGIALGGD